jgi:hypothetical protein
MTTKETIYKKPRIQKFTGKFKEIDGGGTILHTKTIQSIRDPNCLAIYTYLSSKPPEWAINIKEIMSHFIKMGRDKAYKALNDLCLIGLLERKELRMDKGKFKEYIYYLYLEPLPENQEAGNPLPGLPFPGLPLPENQETYKSKSFCIENIDSKKGLIKTPSVFDRQEYSYYESEGKKIPENLLYVKEWAKLMEK